MPYANSRLLRGKSCARGKTWHAKLSLGFLLVLLISNNSLADNENVAAAIDAKTSHWSGYISGSATSNTFEQSAPSSYQALSLSGRIAYSDTWGSLRLSGGGEMETHHNQSYYYDSFLEYRSPSKEFGEDWNYLISAGVYLPTDHVSRENKLEAAPRVAGYLFYRPSENLNIYLSPRVQYNAYKYEIGRNGQHFIEHSISLLTDVTWQFIENWYLDVNASYAMNKPFNTDRYDNRFTISEEIGWTFAPTWVAAIGHNNNGYFFDPDRGPSHSFQLYDERNSTFYFSITKYL